MLSPLDDLPIHQVPEPVRLVGTSDRNFYDRYYFNCHARDDRAFLVMGMGHYPNLGVVDAFAAADGDGMHRVVRASREMGLDRSDTSVGPFRIEVIEGLRRLRFVLEPNEWDLSFDLTWDGSGPAFQEPRHVNRSLGRVTIEACRLAQNGSWSGTLTVGDATHDVDPETWMGSRDRSWGIRPVGEAEPPGIRANAGTRSFFWIYAPMRFDDYSLYFICQEQPDGERVLQEAVRVWGFGDDRAIEHLGHPEHDLTFVPGTRDVESAVLHLGPLEVNVTPLLKMHVGVGTGYGYDAEWRHGMYQGPLVVQGRSWDLTTDEGRAAMFGLVDSVGRFELADGSVGHGLFEYMILGPHDRYDAVAG